MISDRYAESLRNYIQVDGNSVIWKEVNVSRKFYHCNKFYCKY